MGSFTAAFVWDTNEHLPLWKRKIALLACVVLHALGHVGGEYTWSSWTYRLFALLFVSFRHCISLSELTLLALFCYSLNVVCT